MPVRWRIHSSVVSISRDNLALVTTPSGKNMPEPRMTVLGGFTSEIIAIRRVSGRPERSRRREPDSEAESYFTLAISTSPVPTSTSAVSA